MRWQIVESCIYTCSVQAMMTSSRVFLYVSDYDGAGFSINVHEVELGNSNSHNNRDNCTCVAVASAELGAESSSATGEETSHELAAGVLVLRYWC